MIGAFRSDSGTGAVYVYSHDPSGAWKMERCRWTSAAWIFPRQTDTSPAASRPCHTASGARFKPAPLGKAQAVES